ncbi:MAG: DUF5320 domain-containing protein [Bacteroidales bacterium]|nr:DUF5320 domain-containing protein [Bacteroidales bacterium]
MPQGDRSGPMGQGPRTGRAKGFCSGYDTPGYARGFGGGMGRGFGYDRGMGRGRGYGRGWNIGQAFSGFFHGFPWTQSMSKNDEIAMLKSQAEELKLSQKNIEKRLSELEKEGE